jgi:diguanylate cyclase (GGDEF)-like protein
MKMVLILLIFFVELLAQGESVVLQLQWKHQFQFAGFYVAKERGFYKEVGFDVEIKECDYAMNVTDEVISGKAEYGVGRSSLLIAHNSGKPVVALGAIFQSSPSILISIDPKIKEVKDLKAKRVMIASEEADSASMLAMLRSHEITEDDLILQEHTFDLESLINKDTDAMACYLSNEPYQLNERNISYHILNPKEYGYDFYGDILFTSKAQIKKSPIRVRQFYKASMRGWKWAFEHIKETSELILNKYNTQNKSLQSLIYEGNVLKGLALTPETTLGFLSHKRFKEIEDAYRLSGLITKIEDLKEFIDPLDLNKQEVRIGILAKRGLEKTLKRWSDFQTYLNTTLEYYHFKIVPLSFKKLALSVKNGEVDFVLTNTMQYVQLERNYGISRIATLENIGHKVLEGVKVFGGVIVAKKSNTKIHSIKDLKHQRFGAVSPESFGGWVMACDTLQKYDIAKDDINVTFLHRHDDVIYAILNKTVDAGTVRTDTLERMEDEGLIVLDELKVIHQKTYKDFPYLVSTNLYPEWPFSKIKHTSDKLATHLLTALLQMPSSSKAAQSAHIKGWTIPLDYSSVHTLLKHLKIAPYDSYEFSLKDVVQRYILAIYLIGAILILIAFIIIYELRINHYLKSFNSKLESRVQRRTQALEVANANLKLLAQTDPLTGIDNRGYFMSQAENYFELAKRNKTLLQVLSLDIDYFKTVNDTYGHHVGDEMLRLFTKTILSLLRKSDIFGRVGGEEFVICLHDTSNEGAEILAEKILMAVSQSAYHLKNGESISRTLSIGIGHLSDEENFEALLEKSDTALYKAKRAGRNCYKVY